MKRFIPKTSIIVDASMATHREMGGGLLKSCNRHARIIFFFSRKTGLGSRDSSRIDAVTGQNSLMSEDFAMGEPDENEMARLLEDSASDFEVSVRRAFEGILGRPTFSPKDFRVSIAAGEAQTLFCRIHTSNPEFNLTFSMGIEASDLVRLFHGFADEELKMDVFGEIANVVAGRLLGRSSFKSRFGFMKPTVPSFSADGAVSAQQKCVRGKLVLEKVPVFLDLIVVANNKGGRK
jgi:hypothetical protein